MKVINMLPYDLHVYEGNTIRQGPKRSYPKSGKTTRLVTVELGAIRGHELWYQQVSYPSLEEFPDPEQGTVYIVALVAAIACRDRNDLLSPYKKVRDADGTIIGCRHLQKVVHELCRPTRPMAGRFRAQSRITLSRKPRRLAVVPRGAKTVSRRLRNGSFPRLVLYGRMITPGTVMTR